jgi:hypothetical protein
VLIVLASDQDWSFAAPSDPRTTLKRSQTHWRSRCVIIRAKPEQGALTPQGVSLPRKTDPPQARAKLDEAARSQGFNDAKALVMYRVARRSRPFGTRVLTRRDGS